MSHYCQSGQRLSGIRMRENDRFDFYDFLTF